jgi:hypothetical protein
MNTMRAANSPGVMQDNDIKSLQKEVMSSLAPTNTSLLCWPSKHSGSVILTWPVVLIGGQFSLGQNSKVEFA